MNTPLTLVWRKTLIELLIEHSACLFQQCNDWHSTTKHVKCKQAILKVPEKTEKDTLTVAWLQKLENIAKEGACLNNCKFAKVAKDRSICALLFKGKVQ